MTCNQHECVEEAVARFTWPGRDESVICANHLPQLLGVAAALGFHLQVLPVALASET